VNVIVRRRGSVAVNSFTAAQVGVVGFEQERRHADKFALPEILERCAIRRLFPLAGRNRRAGLEIDEVLRRDSFRLSARDGGAKIILDLVLKVAVRRSSTRTLDTTALIDGLLYFDGGEG